MGAFAAGLLTGIGLLVCILLATGYIMVLKGARSQAMADEISQSGIAST